MLAEHLDDLLADEYCCQHILPYLPSEAKACLLAVARLRRLLCDAALLLLADECQTTLDLHSCGEAVSEDGIQAALRRMPHLRQVGVLAGGQRAAVVLLGAAGARRAREGGMHSFHTPSCMLDVSPGFN